MPEVQLALLMIRCACYDFGNCNKRAKTSNGVSSDTNLLPLQIRRPPKTMVFKLVSSTFLLSDQRETKTDPYIRTYSILSKRERERERHIQRHAAILWWNASVWDVSASLRGVAALTESRANKQINENNTLYSLSDRHVVPSMTIDGPTTFHATFRLRLFVFSLLPVCCLLVWLQGMAW